MFDNILVQFAFLFFSAYLTFSAIHEYYATNDSIWLIMVGISGFGIIIQFYGLITLASEHDNDDDDSNGGRKKIYPDNKDYSEKVLELYK